MTINWHVLNVLMILYFHDARGIWFYLRHKFISNHSAVLVYQPGFQKSREILWRVLVAHLLVSHPLGRLMMLMLLRVSCYDVIGTWLHRIWFWCNVIQCYDSPLLFFMEYWPRVMISLTSIFYLLMRGDFYFSWSLFYLRFDICIDVFWQYLTTTLLLLRQHFL